MDKINELIAAKDFESAKPLLVEIINNDSMNVEALKLLGLCNINLGLFKEGKNNFETVVKYNNEDATSWFYLANCYDNLDDYIHAVSAYLEVIKLRENYLDAYKNLGAIYIKNREPMKAFEMSKKALEIIQDDYVLYYMAGTALLAEKQFKESIGYFEKALEFNPNHTQIHNNLGTVYLAIGDYTKAYAAYLKASELNPKNSITFHNIGSILQIQNKHKEACEFFEKAYGLEPLEHYLVSLALSEFKAEMFDSAVKHYKMLISQHPEKHNFKYNLACCYEKMGEYSFAIGILDQLVLLNPKSKVMLQKLADLYLMVNKPNSAKSVYERLLGQGLVSEDIYYQYALICVKTGDLDRAETIFKKVIELNPDAAFARKDLGVIFLRKRLFDYAKEEFELAYKIAPEDEGILFEYANFLYATSDFSKAADIYVKALEKAPRNPHILLFSSLNYLASNKLELALENINRALALVPNDSFMLLTAGKINHAMKNFDQAQVLLIASWELEKTTETENMLGLNYLEQGEYEKANTIFLSLIQKSPMNINLLVSSAKCYYKLGNIDNAKHQLSNALEILPEMDSAIELLKEIESQE